MTRPSCCIVGAGASGLLSAALLGERGWRVAVYEARDRVGGRCAGGTLGGIPVDLGAEFSHGRGPVFDLCAAAGLAPPRPLVDYAEDAPEALRVRLYSDGALVDGNGRDVAATLRMRECWDDVLCDDSWASDARADTTFADLASTLPPSAQRAMDAFMAVEYATSLEDLGVKEWRRREHFFDARDCSTDFHMEGQYAAAMVALAQRAAAAGASLHLRRPVGVVAASDGCVRVDGEAFDCAVVTVPLPVLASGALGLRGVRCGLLEAARRVKCHGASKVMLQLSHKVWERRSGEPATEGRWGELLLCSDEESFARQVWLREAAGGVFIAAGFLAGPRDSALCEALTTEEAAERLLGQLRAVYGMGEELQALDAIKVDWGSDPFSQGGYTSPSVGGCGVWRELRDSGCDRLLLAGEAVGERGSTVCSALESAEWAAARLDRTFGSRAVAD